MVFGGGTGIEAVGPKIFIWPLMCCFLAAAYVWFCCPETTGRTLEEIDYIFVKKEIRDRMGAKGIGRKGGMRRHSLEIVEKTTGTHDQNTVTHEHSLNSSKADVIMTEDINRRDV